VTISSAPRVIAVTGASGYIGTRFVHRLVHEPAVQKVLGIDVRPPTFTDDKVTSIEASVNDSLDTLFKEHSVEAVVHLAFVLRQLRDRDAATRVNVGGASNVLWACEAANVRRIVLMSSSTVYGPHPDNDRLLTEDAPPRPPAQFNYAIDKTRVEWLYRNYASQRPQKQVSILRGCVVMGPRVDNFITQALDKPLLIAVGGDDPPMQFVHEEDLIDLLWRFVSESHPGTYNIAGPGTITWGEVVKLARKRLLRFSAPIAYGLTDLTWKLHLQNDSPGVGLDFIRWPWLVDTSRLERDLRYTFKHTSRQAVEAYLNNRE
jgi:UDP-glucose 4-epimerase